MGNNLIPGKNALWLEYQMAHPLVRKQIQADLNTIGQHDHWMKVSSKEGYPLPEMKGNVRDIFLKHMPETAPHFGLKVMRRAKSDRSPSPAPLFEEATQP